MLYYIFTVLHRVLLYNVISSSDWRKKIWLFFLLFDKTNCNVEFHQSTCYGLKGNWETECLNNNAHRSLRHMGFYLNISSIVLTSSIFYLLITGELLFFIFTFFHAYSSEWTEKSSHRKHFILHFHSNRDWFSDLYGRI